MAIIGTLRLMYEKLAITILPMLIGINPTGIFSASQRVSDAAKLGHMSALTAMYPQMAREQNIATQRMRFGWLLVAAVGLSLGLSLGAESIVGLLFGAAFVESAEGLRILGWVLPAYFIVTYYSLAFVALAIEKPVLISLVISIIVLVILLWWWSPLWGVKGAAWAVLIAEFVQASLLSLQWRAHVVSQSS